MPVVKNVGIYRGLLAEAVDVIKSASAPASAYLAADIVTATPQQLEILLFDSAVRMCRRALNDIDAGNFDEAVDLLKRAGEIMAHFCETSEVADDPELAELFGEVGRRLMEAGFYRRREDIKTAIVHLDARRDDISAHLRIISQHRPLTLSTSPNRCWIG